MNQYLLLRDNKQSGPHSVADLQKMGLKPYDLVWQEGKSAAWRYPGEVDELSAFAPPVEEQPFDRFYKKPEQQSQPNSQPASAQQQSVKLPSSTGKVVVTLPSGITTPIGDKRKTPTDKSVQQPEQVQKIQHTLVVPQPDVEERVSNIAEQQQANAHVPFRESASYTERTVPITQIQETRSRIKAWQWMAEASFGICCLLAVLYYNQRAENKALQQASANSLPANVQPAEPLQVHQVVTENTLTEASEPTSSTESNYFIPEVTDSQETTATKSASTEKPVTTAVPPVQKEKSIVATDIKPTDSMDGRRAIVRESSVREESASEAGQIRKPISDTERKNLLKLVALDNNEFKVGAFGGVSQLQLTLYNKSLYQLSKVEVQVDYLNIDKKVVKSQTVYFESVAPGEQLTLEVPKSGRGVDIRYRVKNVLSQELGLAIAD